MNTAHMTAAARLGHSDNHRRERLLALADLLARDGGGSIELRWPDQNEIALADARRDLTFTDTTANMLTLDQQIRRHSAIARAGASFINLSVTQDSAIPSIDRSKKAAWVGTAADVAPTLDLTTSTPKRLSAYLTASKQLLKLSPILAGGFLEAQLLSAVGAALDDAAINGTGTDEPFGLLADPNIAEHEYSTSIAAADILDMEQAVADNHGEADPSAMAWIADTATRNTLRDTPRAAGITSPVWTDGPNGGPLGYRGIASPWAPAATLIFGHAPDLLILQTGSIEVLVNPYSLDTTGFIRMTVNSWFDFIALNPERSFVRAVPAA